MPTAIAYNAGKSVVMVATSVMFCLFLYLTQLVHSQPSTMS
jgi:hypothetical protein